MEENKARADELNDVVRVTVSPSTVIPPPSAILGEIVRDGVAQGKFLPVDVDQFVIRSRLLMDGLSVDVLIGPVRLTRQRAIAFALGAMDRDLIRERVAS